MGNKIIGIDPGMKNTGYAILEELDNQQIKLLTCGEITTFEGERRFLKIYNNLYDIVKTYEPNLACIENTFLNMNPKTSLALVSGRSISALVMEIFNIPYYQLAPTTIKKAVGGSGFSTKMDISEKIYNYFEVLMPHNATDAVAIAYAGLLKKNGLLLTIKEENERKREKRKNFLLEKRIEKESKKEEIRLFREIKKRDLELKKNAIKSLKERERLEKAMLREKKKLLNKN